MDGCQILSQKLQSKLKQRDNDGRLTEPISPEKLAGLVDFGSNDTLSLSSSGALSRAFMDQLKLSPNFKVGSTSTRIFEGTTQALNDLESDLARLHGAESALFLNSGHDANTAIWSTIPQPGDFVVYDSLAHASIHDGMRLGRAKTVSFPHNDCEGLRQVLQRLQDEHIEVAEGKALVFVAIESFYSMDGDAAPVHEILHTAREALPRQNVLFSIDEAHSNGLVGPNGSGFVCHYGLENDFALRVNTCGKGMGSSGGVVLASQIVKDTLINYARNVVFSTAPSVVALLAVKAGYQLVASVDGEMRRQRLQQNIQHFYQALTSHPRWADIRQQSIIRLPTEGSWKEGPFQSPIIALVTQSGKANSLVEYLHNAKFSVNVARYPIVPKSLERARLCMHADNTAEQIDSLVAAILYWAILECNAQSPTSPEKQKLTTNAVTMIGAGTQGSRLAYMWARMGAPVYVIDKNEDQLAQALATIIKFRENAKSSEERGPIITGTLDMLDAALSSSWLVMECVPERLEIKKAVVQDIENRASPDIIIASNSSSYTMVDIVDGVSLHSKDRLVSLHSYWPPEVTAIEILGMAETRPEIITKLLEETKAHGFEPFEVHRPCMGYMFNRIWAAIKREALATVDEGVASPGEVDGIYKAVTRSPKGPFEQMDVAGLDIILDIENHYATARPNLPSGPRELLHEMVSSGKLGVKSGGGFYDYDKGLKNETVA